MADNLKNINNKNNKNIIVAVDVGTTTIGVSCLDSDKRSVITEFSFSNPQKIYGADVITRIKYCLDVTSAESLMSDMLLMKLNEELKKALVDDYNKITSLCYSGNTTMFHILRRLPVEGLSASPFRPVTLDYFECNVSHNNYANETIANINANNTNKSIDHTNANNANGLLNDSNVIKNTSPFMIKEYFLPGLSAFVGADILSGAVYLNMGSNEKYDLLVDLGTNGEMVLLNNKCGYATSTACGPVFDHGINGAVYGSDCINAIANCIKRGLIDGTGLISEMFFEKGIMINNELIIKQEQVRRFQMAKAAIYAGIICLMNKAGIKCDDIETVYVSGGLGFYMDIKDAFTTKLLPKQLDGKIKVSGNTSLEGAKKYLLSYERDVILEKFEDIRRKTKAFELADYPDFQDIYISSMNF